MIEPNAVDAENFNIKFYTWDDSVVYGVKVGWIAYDTAVTPAGVIQLSITDSQRIRREGSAVQKLPGGHTFAFQKRPVITVLGKAFFDVRHIALYWLDKPAIFRTSYFNGPELGRERFFPVDSFFPFSDLLLAEVTHWENGEAL